MNLIRDAWISVERANGEHCLICPWEIGSCENPVVEIKVNRPDFRGSIFQFFIGLLQTVFTPETEDDWLEYFEDPPSQVFLKELFEPLAEVFELYSDSGPAFLQDLQMPQNIDETPIRNLLIESPGNLAVKENRDFFNKRTLVNGLCDDCVATALLTLNLNAPAGGAGVRTGLRGGGPLTTLVVLQKGYMLWQNIWLNIISNENKTGKDFCFDKDTLDMIFPWMGITRESINNQTISPGEVNELQQFWGMPRRIRITEKKHKGKCDCCGKTGLLRSSYYTKNYGNNYGSTWNHTLSPYRLKIDKTDQATSLLAYKGQQGGYTYSDWLALTLVSNECGEKAALVVQLYNSYRYLRLKNQKCYIWCFGFDMDKAKARCWYDQQMPYIHIKQELEDIYIARVALLIQAAKKCEELLVDSMKLALFDKVKGVSGTLDILKSIFWSESQVEFFEVASTLQDNIIDNELVSKVCKGWRLFLINKTESLFDRYAMQNTDDLKNMKKIANATSYLHNLLFSKKTSALAILMEDIE